MITKSHIAANFPASVHTGILQGHRNSSVGDMDSSDASPWSLSFQLPCFLCSGARDAALGPTSHLLCWPVVAEAGRGSRSKCRAAAPGPLQGQRWECREAEERLHHEAVTRQAQSIRKGCHPCRLGNRVVLRTTITHQTPLAAAVAADLLFS